MFNNLKDAIRITNSNIILTIPLIIFIKVLDLYSAYSRYNLNSIPKLIIATITVLLMFGIFCAFWFYMIKGAIDNSTKIYILDADRTKASLNLFKTILEGISKFFLSFSGVYIIYGVIQIFMTPIVYIAGTKIIGTLDVESLNNIQELAITAANDNGIFYLIDKLSIEQILFFAKWSFMFMLVTSMVMYLLMFWIPEIMYKTPNPIKALFKSIKNLFKKFFETICLFSILWFIGFILLFLNTFSLINPFAYLFMNVVLFYFSLYLVICIFLYYYRRFITNEQ